MSAISTHTKDQADRGLQLLARLGFAAKGIVFMLVAALAIQVAAGVGGRTTDPKGALSTLLGQPFGKALLGAIAVGLVGYALWRFAQAIKAPEGEKPLKRVGAAATGLVYSSMALFAAHLAYPRVPAGGGGGSGDAQLHDFTAQLMAQPFGRWLVALVGLGVIGFGLKQLWNGLKGHFEDPLNTSEMAPGMRHWSERLGRTGYAAFGLVFLLVGGFFVMAAWQARPQQTHGLGGTLATLAAQPAGDLLLMLLALGLAAYGAYQLVVARYRRMGPIVT